MNTQEYRALMGRFATGVTVVTTMDEQGHPVGLTANSLSSVSLEPCLLSLAVERRSQSFPALVAHGRFAVNILNVEQEGLARTFASPARREERWAGVAWHTSPLGCPVLEGCLAWFECSVWSTVEAGDHILILGEVLGGSGTEDEPLVYYRGAYRTVGP